MDRSRGVPAVTFLLGVAREREERGKGLVHGAREGGGSGNARRRNIAKSRVEFLMHKHEMKITVSRSNAHSVGT